MFEFFKKDMKVGDKVKLYLTTGKEPEGTVVEIGDCFVLLQNADRIQSRIFDKLLGGWEILNKTVAEIKTDDVKIVSAAENSKLFAPNTIGVKVVGHIPLEQLDNRKRFSSKPKGDPQMKQNVRGFSEPNDFFAPEPKRQMNDGAEQENDFFVNANGYIIKYFADRQFGYVLDSYGYELYYHISDIQDNVLSGNTAVTSTKLQIPVLFTFLRNYRGDKAVLIHKPEKVKAILDRARFFADQKDYNTALGFIEQILYAYPNNNSAIKLQQQIQSEIKPWTGDSNNMKSHESNYQKAVTAKNIDKDFDTALKYYMLALENNEKRESCIKDTGMLYVSMGETDKAFDFIDKYGKELPEGVTTYNYFVNFYSAVKNFDTVLEYINLILEDKTIEKDQRKMSLYLSQKGYVLIQLNRKEEARKVLKESLEYTPDSIYVNRLLESLDAPDEGVVFNFNQKTFNN